MLNNYSPLSNHLNKDIDALILWVAEHKPSHRKRLLEEALAIAKYQKENALTVSKCLAVVQSVLSGIGIAMSDNDCTTGLINAIEICRSQGNVQNQKKSLAVAMLFARRLGKKLCYIPEDTTKLLTEMRQKTEDARIVESLDSILTLVRSSTESALSRAVKRQRVFDIDELNILAARDNVIADAPQDWFADPWHWPELKMLNVEAIEERLRKPTADWTLALDVPKQSQGVRPAIVLSPIDRIAYQAIADELSIAATSRLHEWVFGWRIKRSNARKGEYEDNKREWKMFLERITALTERYSYVTRVDVRSFFETVKTDQLIQQISRRYRRSAIIDRLDEYFQQWSMLRNGNGLPQRSLASSILAHIPLQNLDAYLQQKYLEEGAGSVSPVRWMDDIWLFGDYESALNSTVIEIESILEADGLGLNPEKTVLVRSQQAASNMFRYTSGENELVENDSETDESMAQVKEILARIEEAPRSAFSFFAKFEGRNEEYVAKQFGEVAVKHGLDDLSYSADHIANLLRKSGEWRAATAWYTKYVQEVISSESWTVPSWGLMFPLRSDLSPELKSVENAFESRFDIGIQRSLVPLAAHRLAAWNTEKAKDVLISFLYSDDMAAHPLILRSCCFAGLQAGLTENDLHVFARNSYDPTLGKIIAAGSKAFERRTEES